MFVVNNAGDLSVTEQEYLTFSVGRLCQRYVGRRIHSLRACSCNLTNSGPYLFRGSATLR